MKASAPCVRFAPSPTGPLHIGALRTAVFNYLFAKGRKGRFLLRIEDTDRRRYIPEAASYIQEALHWLGIPPDDTLSSQAAQTHYLRYAHMLHSQGKAYYAFDTPEELETMRATLKSQGMHEQHYNILTRKSMKNELSLSQEEVQARLKAKERPVLRFKVPPKQTIRFKDSLRGHIRIHSSTLEDKILIKADGMPTYHFAHVVDDHRTGITHVIRGEEWLPSTALHVLLYEAFGWKTPVFAHLPLLLKPEGKGKLSKRDAEIHRFPIYPLHWKKQAGFREEGFLVEAVFNFLACLGWQPPPGQEILDKNTLLQHFSLDQISKSGAHFDIEKARWYNQQYLRRLSPETLAKRLKQQYPKLCQRIAKNKLLQTVKLMQPRAVLLPDILHHSTFLRSTPGYPPLPEEVIQHISLLKAYEKQLSPPLSAPEAKNQYLALAKAQHVATGPALRTLRFALSAELKGPDLGEIMQILGTTEIKKRLQQLLSTHS